MATNTARGERDVLDHRSGRFALEFARMLGVPASAVGTAMRALPDGGFRDRPADLRLSRG